MISKAAVSRYFYNVDSDNEVKRVLSTGPVEMVAIVLSSGTAASAARIYDAANANNGDPTTQSILITAKAGDSRTIYLGRHQFKKGLTVIIEEGGSPGAPFGAECAVFYD